MAPPTPAVPTPGAPWTPFRGFLGIAPLGTHQVLTLGGGRSLRGWDLEPATPREVLRIGQRDATHKALHLRQRFALVLGDVIIAVVSRLIHRYYGMEGSPQKRLSW